MPLMPFGGLAVLVVSVDSEASSGIVAVCIGVVVGSFGWRRTGVGNALAEFDSGGLSLQIDVELSPIVVEGWDLVVAAISLAAEKQELELPVDLLSWVVAVEEAVSLPMQSFGPSPPSIPL